MFLEVIVKSYFLDLSWNRIIESNRTYFVRFCSAYFSLLLQRTGTFSSKPLYHDFSDTYKVRAVDVALRRVDLWLSRPSGPVRPDGPGNPFGYESDGPFQEAFARV
jgi:hypothetical protein